MKKFLICFIFLCGIVFSEEAESTEKTFEFTELEVNEMFSTIKNLEHKDSLNILIIKEHEYQIKLLNQYMANDKDIINQLEYQLDLKNKIIKEVKPKWHENKYLWFFFGVAMTATSVKLAGEIVD